MRPCAVFLFAQVFHRGFVLLDGCIVHHPHTGKLFALDETFAQKLLDEERVAVVPGNSFGVGGEGFVRCSYATAYEKIEEALRRMQHFMHRHG